MVAAVGKGRVVLRLECVEAELLAPLWWIPILRNRVLEILGREAELEQPVQRLVEPRAYPHDDAARDIGYAPVGFSEGVKDEVEAYLARKKTK